MLLRCLSGGENESLAGSADLELNILTSRENNEYI